MFYLLLIVDCWRFNNVVRSIGSGLLTYHNSYAYQWIALKTNYGKIRDIKFFLLLLFNFYDPELQIETDLRTVWWCRGNRQMAEALYFMGPNVINHQQILIVSFYVLQILQLHWRSLFGTPIQNYGRERLKFSKYYFALRGTWTGSWTAR